MPTPIVRSETFEADIRLTDLGLSRSAILEVLAVAFAEHGNCNENDPAGSRGLAVYRWCVRGLREQYRSAGWDLDRTGGIETIVHHEKKIRIAVINTDAATCNPHIIPQNSSRKGPNSERAAATNAQMFPGAEEWPVVAKDGRPVVTDDYATWHLCVHIDGNELRAELSLLVDFNSGFFCDARERIFLVKNGEWNPLSIEFSDEEPGASGASEFDVAVRRKK